VGFFGLFRHCPLALHLALPGCMIDTGQLLRASTTASSSFGTTEVATRIATISTVSSHPVSASRKHLRSFI
jgi:hypothetical protein